MSANGGAANALVTGVSALVSGATGFLGRYLLAGLQAGGFKVSALARPTSETSGIVRSGVDVHPGDVLDMESLRRAMRTQQVVFHTAGRVSDRGSHQDFWRANVDGTANVIAACRQAGVKRLLHVSSLTVLGLPRSGIRVDEHTPPATRLRDPYSASKLAGEMLVREAHGHDGLETVVIRPGVIWGPGDATVMPRLLALLRRRRLIFIGNGSNHLGISHVANLSQALVLAATSPVAAGQLYHVTDGEEITARDVFTALAAAQDLPPPRRSLPFPVAYLLAMLAECSARWRSAPPGFSRYGVRLVACDCRYDIGKVRRELDYRPTIDFRQGMASLFAQERPA